MSNGKFTIQPSESIKLLVKTCLEEGITDVGQIANVLAQCEHETGGWIWSREIGCKAQAARLGYQGGGSYCGRGYIQLTHKTNYEKMGRILGVDLVNNPAKAEEPVIAAKITVIGMRDGVFTGRKLSQYINNGSNDFYNARRIVNSLDQATKLANKSKEWLKQVPDLINGADPDLSGGPTSTSASALGGTVSNNNSSIFTPGSIGVCSEVFPREFSLKEGLTYVGCFSRQTGSSMGASNSLAYSANGMKINGGTTFDIADFNPTVPICNGCLGFPHKRDIRITSPFCQRRTSKRTGNVYYHSGTDYGSPQGEPVLAVADGTVISPLIAGDGYNPGFVDIIHEHLGNLLSRSAHIIPAVQPGTKVKQGDIIGTVGPYPSGGPHLHLELRKDKGAGGSAFSIHECKTKFLDPAIFCRGN